jgi:hypothetical protein
MMTLDPSIAYNVTGFPFGSVFEPIKKRFIFAATSIFSSFFFLDKNLFR